MATSEREKFFRANEIEDMCKKRSEEYKCIKASWEAWCLDQQRKRDTEEEKLGKELDQLRVALDDAEREDSRATEELGQLLSRPLMHRDDSPDIEELFAETDRWHSDLRRIRANRDHPEENKKTIMSNIEEIQNKLKGLPAAYDLVWKEEARRVRKQLAEIWQPTSQPDSSTTSLSNDVARSQTRPLTRLSSFAAEGFSPGFFAETRERRHERSREGSLEIISSTEFKQSITPSRSISHSFPGPTGARAPNNKRASGVSMETPQLRLLKPSSNAAVLFRDRQGRYQAERARPGWKPYCAIPQEHESLDPEPSPAFSQFGHVDTDSFLNARAEGTHVNKEPTGRNRVENAQNWHRSTHKAQADIETIVVSSVEPGSRQLPNPCNRTNTEKQEEKRLRSQVSSSDSESDLPLAKTRKKAERTIHFDQVNAENKNWRQGEKIYIISEYLYGSNKWYIFPCKKHCTGLVDAKGAAKHLRRLGHGQRPGRGPRKWTLPEAVEKMGVRVVGCDSEKSRRNNKVFKLAQREGYHPKKRCNNSNCPVDGPIDDPYRHSNSGSRQQSENIEDSELSSDEVYFKMLKGQGDDVRVPDSWQQLDQSSGVLHPVPGELYQAYWASHRSWYPVTVLPWGDLGEVGMSGSLDETDLFMKQLPTCFAVEKSQDGLRTVGWKKEFESHQRRAYERKFPCMFFEGKSAVLQDEESPRPVPDNLAWVMARNLREIDYHHPEIHFFNETGLEEAKAFRQRVIMLKSKGTIETARFSQSLVDDDSDIFDVYEPNWKHSTQPEGVKIEPGSDDAF